MMEGNSLFLPPGTMVKCWPELPLRAISGSMPTEWWGSVSMFVPHIASREHGDMLGLSSHQGLHGCPEAMVHLPWLKHLGDPALPLDQAAQWELALVVGV